MQLSSKRFLFFSFMVVGLFSSSFTLVTAGDRQASFCEKLQPCKLLTQPEAEKIFGQSARQTQNTSELKGEVRQCSCAYTSVSNAQAGGQDINLYFSLEQKEGSPSIEQARQVMESTKNQNAHDLTIVNLSDIGDEAFLLGGLPNKHFIMARKGAVIIRLQIRASESASLDRLKSFAQKVTRQL